MARSFNGTSDKIILPNVNIGTTPISLSVWANLTAAGSFNSMFTSNKNGTFDGYDFQLTNTNPPKVSLTQNETAAIFTSTGTVSVNTWHQVGATYDGTNWKCYIDGALDSSGTNAIVVATTPYAIGYDGASNVQFFHGSLADCAMWTVVLTAPEMAMLGRGARPSAVRPSKLQVYLPLDGYGQSALDRSIHNLTGTLTGTTFIPGPPLINAAPIMLTTVSSNEAFLQRNPLMVAAALPKKGAAVVSSVVFRKTLSQIGGRVGTRQIQGWAN